MGWCFSFDVPNPVNVEGYMKVDRMVIDGLPADAPELALSRLLDEYRTAREQRFTASSSSLMYSKPATTGVR